VIGHGEEFNRPVFEMATGNCGKPVENRGEPDKIRGLTAGIVSSITALDTPVSTDLLGRCF
jgi:hypothetical protein